MDQVELGSGRRRRTFPLETFATQHRTPLRRLKGDGRVLTASGTGGAGLHLLEIAAAPAFVSHGSSALGLAIFAALGLVLELLVVEEELFAGGEDEIITAIDAFQSLILEFHGASPYPTWLAPWAEDHRNRTARVALRFPAKGPSKFCISLCVRPPRGPLPRA